MLPCHSCYIYGTGRRKEMGRVEGFNRGVDPKLFYQNHLPISASAGYLRVLMKIIC